MKMHRELDKPAHVQDLTAGEEVVGWFANFGIDVGQYWCSNQESGGSSVYWHLDVDALYCAHNLRYMFWAEFVDEGYERCMIALRQVCIGGGHDANALEDGIEAEC